MQKQGIANLKIRNIIKKNIVVKEDKYNLFLDDFRMPSDAFSYMFIREGQHRIKDNRYLEDWVIVRNYDEFVKCIEEKGLPEMISFDHDLADVHYGVQDHVDQDYYDMVQERTGYHCAQWMINYCMDNNKKLPPVILIHSMNTVGARNIKSLFKTYLKVHGE